MRVDPLRRLKRAAGPNALRAASVVLSVLACALTAAAVLASEPALGQVQVRITAPEVLTQGSHVDIAVDVEFAAPNTAPLLLTPSSEGAAVEVVRGRLLRSDARGGNPRHLRFAVPIMAQSPGTAILHVEVAAYVCQTRCLRVAASASQVLRVASR